MDFTRALSQIAEIHQQIAKGEIYRGYKPLPVAASGGLGLLAAAAQPHLSDATDAWAFVWYWTAAAALAATVGLSEITYNYVRHEPASGRRRTRLVVGQFLPGMAAGAVLTAALVHADARLAAMLPGAWAVCFGVGILGSRPYLPRSSGIVALFYLAAGAALLWTVDLQAAANGWHVGLTFGAGQLLAAAVLHRDVERTEP